MNVDMFTVGPVAENCFLFSAEGSGEALIVDPGDESERLRLVRHIARRMETAIREHPDQWFVFQPEWITSDAS